MKLTDIAILIVVDIPDIPSDFAEWLGDFDTELTAILARGKEVQFLTEGSWQKSRERMRNR